MKSSLLKYSLLFAAVYFGLLFQASGQDIFKANNNDDLNQSSSWVGGIAPAASNTATWDADVTGSSAISLGGDLSWVGLQILNPGGGVTIQPGNTLTLGSTGILMGSATQNLTLNCNVTLSANQSWNVASGRQITVNGVVSGIGTLNKVGPGLLIFSGNNTFSGDVEFQYGGDVNHGIIRFTHSNALGSGAKKVIMPAINNSLNRIQLDGGIEINGVDIETAGRQNLTGNGVFLESISGNNTWNGNIVITADGGSYSTRALADTLTINGNMGNLFTGSERAYSFVGPGLIKVTGVIGNGSGTTRLNKIAGGKLILTNSNTYTGRTTINGGILEISAAERIHNSSNILLEEGGILSTGATVGYNETVGTLRISGNSSITLGSGDHTLSFAASNGTVWTAGQLLITGWSDIAKYNGTAAGPGHPKIFVGSTSSHLTATQVSQIVFIHPVSNYHYGAVQLATGEVVPTSTILPVDLLEFYGKENENTIDLYWKTTNEKGSNYFEVMYSNDGYNFKPIGKVTAAGNANSTVNYSFKDENPHSGNNYYRLYQYDQDGSMQRSNVISVKKSVSGGLEGSLYPNPSESTAYLQFKSSENEQYKIYVYSNTGLFVMEKVVNAVPGVNKVLLPSHLWADGVYIVYLSKAYGNQTELYYLVKK